MKDNKMKPSIYDNIISKFILLALMLLLANCSSNPSIFGNKSDTDAAQNANAQSGLVNFGANATPGSEGDFIFNIGDHVFFPVNQTTLTYEGAEVLRKQAQWLNRYTHIQLLIQGHADERGTREYNLALGAKRSSSVFNYLISQGVNPSRLSKTTIGKEKPKATCPNESCWSQNRRSVSIVTNAPRT